MGIYNNFDVLSIRDYYPSNNNPTSSTWVYNQVVSLNEKGFKPLVISPTPINPLKRIFKQKYRLYDSPSSSIDVYKGTQVIRPPYLKIPFNWLKKFTIDALSRSILQYGYIQGIKLIHAHFGQNGVASIPLKDKLKVPLITSFYGYDTGRLSKLFKPFYKDLINKGDLFLVLSNDMKSDLLQLGFPEEKIVVHRLGIDLEKFCGNSLTNEKFVILTVARLDETKGIQYVLEALSLFFQRYPAEKEHIVYRVIGGGIFEDELKKLVERLDIRDNVEFINNLIIPNGRELVLSEMQNCDLFALCSALPVSGGKEGTPIVLMEAQACKKPCISTFHAGIPEVVLNGKTGILVNEHSSVEIAEAFSDLYFDKEKRIYFGHNARKHIQTFYNQEIQMNELFNLYSSLLNK